MITDISTAGAVPGSAADIGPIIQAVINAGDVPVISKGPYRWESTVILPRGQRSSVRGDGYCEVLTSFSGPLLKFYRAAGEARGDVTITDLSVAQQNPGSGTVIEFGGANNTVSDNWLRAERCEFRYFDKAFAMRYCGGGVSNTRLYGNTRDFSLERGASFLALTDVFSLNGAFFIYGEDALADGYSNGITLQNCDSVLKTQSDVWLKGWDAIQVQGGGFDLGGSGNGVGQAAFRLERCTNVSIAGSWIASNPGTPRQNRAGVYLHDCQDVDVDGNKIKNHAIGIWSRKVSTTWPGNHSYRDNSMAGNVKNHIVAVGVDSGFIGGNRFDNTPPRTGTDFQLFMDVAGNNGWRIAPNLFAGSPYSINVTGGTVVEGQQWNVAL
jgi:hypothetical protein